MKTESKIVVPKAEYHIGDRVWVKCQESGMPPAFEATICAIDAHPKRCPDPEYAVVEDDGMVSDGYTKAWLMRIPPEGVVPGTQGRVLDQLRACGWHYDQGAILLQKDFSHIIIRHDGTFSMVNQ